jgi:hypothetical protein
MSKPLYGLLAEFHSPTDLVRAAHEVHARGYTKVDAYTPYPMEEVIEALHLGHSHLPKLVLGGGIAGLLGGWGLQYWSSVIEYPLNIGGRPFNAWPAFVVPAFETTVLLAALSADRFFICIEAADPNFDRAATREFLQGLGAEVMEADE